MKNPNLNYHKGTQDAKGVEMMNPLLFTRFWMEYKSKAILSEACRAVHDDLIR